MAEREIVVVGSRWELFAAAYEVASSDGYAVTVDASRASFAFDASPLFLGHRRHFDVWVSELQRTRSVVHVECTVERGSVWGSATYECEERRAAAKFLERFEHRRTLQRRSYAPPGWYPVRGTRAQRYWNGNGWTPWLWVHDSLVLDAPGGFGFALTIDPVEIDVVDAGGRVPMLEHMTETRLSPPLLSPKRVVGAARWRRRRIRDLVLAIFWCGALAAIVYLRLEGV